MNPLHSYSRQAFSLIEVTIALAVAAFGLISISALLPIGLKTFNDSIADTARAEISQQLFTMAHETEFSQLDRVASPDSNAPLYYYFDDAATPLTAANKSQAVYTAALSHSNSSVLPGNSTTSSLVVLKIEIYRNHGVFAGGAPVDPEPTKTAVILGDFGQRL